jgi:hypothetical protein
MPQHLHRTRHRRQAGGRRRLLMLHHHGRGCDGGGVGGGGGHHGLAGRPDPEDLVLARLCLDEEVAGLAGRNTLARLQRLQGGEGDGDLGAGLAGSQARLVDHNLLDGGGVVLLLRRLKEERGHALETVHRCVPVFRIRIRGMRGCVPVLVPTRYLTDHMRYLYSPY